MVKGTIDFDKKFDQVYGSFLDENFDRLKGNTKYANWAILWQNILYFIHQILGVKISVFDFWSYDGLNLENNNIFLLLIEETEMSRNIFLSDLNLA